MKSLLNYLYCRLHDIAARKNLREIDYDKTDEADLYQFKQSLVQQYRDKNILFFLLFPRLRRKRGSFKGV